MKKIFIFSILLFASLSIAHAKNMTSIKEVGTQDISGSLVASVDNYVVPRGEKINLNISFTNKSLRQDYMVDLFCDIYKEGTLIQENARSISSYVERNKTIKETAGFGAGGAPGSYAFKIRALIQGRMIAQHDVNFNIVPQDPEFESYLDIPYTNPIISSKQYLDLFVPSEGLSEPYPVIIFIHGGAWHIGDKANIHEKLGLVEAGYILANTNYPLSPQVQHPSHVQSISKAIAWVYDNISSYGGDPEKIFIAGHSAGAQLASLSAIDETYLVSENLPPETIKGVICLDSGFYNILSRMENDPDDELISIIHSAFGENPDVWIDASPELKIASAEYIPPFFIAFCRNRQASRIQSISFAQTLLQNDVEGELYPSEGTNHEMINQNFGNSEDITTQRALSFIENILEESE